MNNSPNRRAVTEGMQAIEKGGHKVSTSELTRSRANAVKNLLVQLGVPDSILPPRGLGSDFEGHLDEVENGTGRNLEPHKTGS
ncbi:MAG: hypothetical protein LBP35_06605 [Candidatus Ancillula trichonymphae]|nr:hypothetical protein [Candidatus Ancillula trichonymphae]